MNMENNEIDTLYSSLEKKSLDAYSVGPLLYSPATNTGIYGKIKGNRWSRPYSLALCLEDTIDESAVAAGEENIVHTLNALYLNRNSLPYLPKIFIRVRYPSQIVKLYQALCDAAALLTGFILPKFCPENMDEFLIQMTQVNQTAAQTVYFMPILESGDLIPLHTRAGILNVLYQKLSAQASYILNIRVGGNDLCNAFGLRRNVTETIYDIGPVAHILNDIVTTFYHDFVISGPVWEYFADENTSWKRGLEQEMRMDILNGFVGKTVIHPNQIDVVNHSLMVNKHDLEDALNILRHKSNALQVEKSSAGTRMNEIKTHTNWAQKQLILSHIYGVR